MNVSQVINYSQVDITHIAYQRLRLLASPLVWPRAAAPSACGPWPQKPPWPAARGPWSMSLSGVCLAFSSHAACNTWLLSSVAAVVGSAAVAACGVPRRSPSSAAHHLCRLPSAAIRDAAVHYRWPFGLQQGIIVGIVWVVSLPRRWGLVAVSQV